MNIEKWDGITDADLIFDALTHFISKSDVEAGLCRSYGDFGNDIHRKYSNSVGTDNENYKVAGYNNRIEVEIVKKNIVYVVTWNKAAKLIHKRLKSRRDNNA